MSFDPKPFGKYFLIDRLAVGGMAEIYKAKTFGVDGFEKLLAIKKILPHYSLDKEFISMLTDEAKLVVRLSHANIVQIYDLGKVGQDYFISMEYIDGVNLRQLANRAKERKQKIPLPICLYIISEVCKGLDYAHSKRGEKGDPLGIVHRDISPQNILLSYEGETKIVDFGIAKAAMNVSHTSVGILKGKITYMSPEQALGKPVDARTDIFSTGILLYELITGKRLFTGETQMEILKKIRETHFTSQSFLDEIPDEKVREVLAKALAYNVKDRYESAGDLQIDLTKLIYSQFLDFSPKELPKLIKGLFSDEFSHTHQKQAQEEAIPNKEELAEKSQQILVHAEKSKVSKKQKLEDTKRPEQGIIPEQFKNKTDPVHKKESSFSEKSVVHRLAKKQIALPWLIGFGVLLLLIGAVGYWWFFYQTQHQGSLKITSVPNQVSFFLNGKPYSEKTPALITGLVLDQELKITLRADDYFEQTKAIKLSDEKLKSLHFELKKIPKAAIEVTSIPKGAQIFLDGKDSGFTTPKTFLNLDLKKTYQIELKKEGYQPFSKEVEASDQKTYQISSNLQPIRYGELQIITYPDSAKIFLNEELFSQKAPVTLKKLAIGKVYKVRLELEKYETESFEVIFDKEQTIKKEFQLTKKKEFSEATLTIKANIPVFFLKVNGDYLGKYKGPLKIEPGLVEVLATKKGYQNHKKSLRLKGGEEYTLALDFKPEEKKEESSKKDDKKQDLGKIDAMIKVDSKPSGAKVYLSGRYKGITPLSIPVSKGTWSLVVKKQGYRDYRQKVSLKNGQTRTIRVNFRKTGSKDKDPDLKKDTGKKNPKDDSKQPKVKGYGSLRIDSNPRGASLIVNGKKAGITPTVVSQIPLGKASSIVLDLPGYRKKALSYTLKKKYQELTIKLQK